jgi:hypothetical protein
VSIPTQPQFRAYAGADTPLTAWVRDEAGKQDLSAVESLTVEISRKGCPLLTLEADSPEAGRVDFTLTAENVQQQLNLLGVFRLRIIADNRVIQSGLLTVLG